MTIMNERLFSFGVSFALPKNSPYTAKYDPGMSPRALYYSVHRFSTKIQQLKESGLIDHWISVEQDKVARLAKIGTATRDVVGLSVSNLQVRRTTSV